VFVTHLSLVDFRSYAAVDVAMGAGVMLFVGSNGQGKTNLVEAVEYLSSLSSHRVSSDTPLVRAGSGQALVRGRVQASGQDGRNLLLEVEINPGRANRARINKAPLTRARDVLGVLRTVVFSPEDLAIVKGDPVDRRNFLDGLVVTRWPRMAGVRSDYDRILKQRNTLLKSLAGRLHRAPDPDALPTLDVWDQQLSVVAAELLAARLDTLREVMPHVSDAYAAIAPVNNEARAEYRASIDLTGVDPRQSASIEELQQRVLAAMDEKRGDEMRRGVSLVGPHRDDVSLSIGELPAKGYASHGEAWSLALALRLGSYALLRADGVEPVLVLDDVFAELDVQRRERLAARILEAEQVIITAAVVSDVPEQLQQAHGGQRFTVNAGTVVADEPAGTFVADQPAGASATPAPTGERNHR